MIIVQDMYKIGHGTCPLLWLNIFLETFLIESLGIKSSRVVVTLCDDFVEREWLH